MRAGVTDRGHSTGQNSRHCTQNQYPDRHHQQRDHQPLDLLGLKFFSEVLRGSTNHQPGQKDGNKDVQQHPVKPRTHPPEDHFTDHHIDQRNHPAQRVKAVVHAVHRTVGRRGSGFSPQHRPGGAKAYFLAFQRCALFHQRAVERGIGLIFGIQRGAATDQKQRQHTGDNGPALTQILDVMAEGKHQRNRDQND